MTEEFPNDNHYVNIPGFFMVWKAHDLGVIGFAMWAQQLKQPNDIYIFELSHCPLGVDFGLHDILRSVLRVVQLVENSPWRGGTSRND